MRSVLCLLATLPSLAFAAPGYVPVQGVLTDSNGAAVDGSVDVTFTLYDDSSGSTSLWTDTLTVVVTDGRFAVALGSNLPLDLTTFENYAGAHLGIQVSGDTEMALVPLDHVPYAAHAEHATNADTVGGESLSGIVSQIPLTSDIQTAALGVCLPSTYVPDWTDLTGVPTGFSDGVDDELTQAEVEGFARGVAYDTLTELTDALDSRYLSSGETLDWNDLTNVPSGLADGDDDTQLSQATVEGYARGVAYDTVAELTGDLDAEYQQLVPNDPSFCAYDSAGGNDGTNGVYIGNTEWFEVGGNNHDATTGYFTAPVAGVYEFTWSAYTNEPTGRTFLFSDVGTLAQTNGNGISITAMASLAAGQRVWLGGTASYRMTWYGAGGHNIFCGKLIQRR
ncbi:MAG: hypothetical protein EP330_27620 [Deltaproteobacteria bacterium]|nr:MAG: hypothetical protein EP330_27620 [Deltaproteobacteria bacterium]